MDSGRALPRCVIAGLAGGSEKTLVSMALLLAAQRSGQPVCAFKKGPDYIDSAWLSWASGRRARNLDAYLMGPERTVSSFLTNATADGLNLIEGNRGLFDGMDAAGTYSSAALARSLQAPVVLIVNVTKVTRTVAAYILGCQALDPELNLAGIILNCVNGRRHEQVVRDAIQLVSQVPVVGVVPKLDMADLVPERHLGLVTPEEHKAVRKLERKLLDSVLPGLDVNAIMRIAHAAPPLRGAIEQPAALPGASGLKIGYLKDSAFSFYYAENLEALERAGARLMAISPITAKELPKGISALYMGGGFPETHAGVLAANTSFLASLRAAARSGLPIYAECGGLMLLSQAIIWQGDRYPMAGVFPFNAQVCSTAQGHGYAELLVDRPNPFFFQGTELRGHEFHYSRIAVQGTAPFTACQMRRGTGVLKGRDGLVVDNVWAAYTHLHALATPEWGTGMIAAARRFASEHRGGRMHKEAGA